MEDTRRRDGLLRRQYGDARKLDARIALHAGYSVNPLGWARWLFEQIELEDDAEILELGCGPGLLWHENADRIPPGWRIRLSDFSAGMLDEARARLSDVPRAFSFEIIDAHEIPHSAARFDAVFANHMLYHLPGRPRALGEIARVLRPGGRLVASTLADDTMAELEALIRSATPRSDFRFMRDAANFSLDRGEAQLAPFFDPVETRRYEDALEITEVGPLLAYLRSMMLDEPLDEDELASIAKPVRAAIAARGSFHVSKDSGVFLARAPAKAHSIR